MTCCYVICGPCSVHSVAAGRSVNRRSFLAMLYAVLKTRIVDSWAVLSNHTFYWILFHLVQYFLYKLMCVTRFVRPNCLSEWLLLCWLWIPECTDLTFTWNATCAACFSADQATQQTVSKRHPGSVSCLLFMILFTWPTVWNTNVWWIYIGYVFFSSCTTMNCCTVRSGSLCPAAVVRRCCLVALTAWPRHHFVPLVWH